MTPHELAIIAAKALDEKKGKEIAAIEVSEQTTLADYFVIATGSSNTQINALSGSVEKALKEQADEMPLRREGYRDGTWVLLDYGSVVVHIFSQEVEFLVCVEEQRDGLCRGEGGGEIFFCHIPIGPAFHFRGDQQVCHDFFRQQVILLEDFGIGRFVVQNIVEDRNAAGTTNFEGVGGTVDPGTDHCGGFFTLDHILIITAVDVIHQQPAAFGCITLIIPGDS